MMNFASSVQAGEVQTQEGCKIVTPGVNKPSLSAPSWSGECDNGLISGVGRYRMEYIDSEGRRQITESWFEARSGWYAMNVNPYYYGVYSEGRIGYWRSRDSGFTDQFSVNDCRSVQQCNLILAKREADVGLEQNAGKSTDGEQESKQLLAQLKVETEAAKSKSFLGMLGAVAQGAASGGGKNAAQLQALGSALQGGSTSPNAATSAYQGNASGSTVSDISPTSPSVDHCVKLGRPRRHQVSFSNSCNFPIQVTYCFIDMSGNNSIYDASDALCQKLSRYHASSTPSIPAGESNSQNAPDNKSNVNFIACPSGDIRAQSNFRWEGGRIKGTCGGVNSRENNANNGSARSGAIR